MLSGENAGLLAALGKNERVLALVSVWIREWVRASSPRLLRFVVIGVIRWFPDLVGFGCFSRFDGEGAALFGQGAGLRAVLGGKERVLS